MKYILMASLAVLVSACNTTPVEQRGVLVPGSEIAERFKEATTVSWDGFNEHGTATFFPDGKTTGNYGNGKEYGNWSIKGDAVCVSYAEAIWHGDLCGVVYKTEGLNHVVYDAERGNKLAQFRF